MEHDLSSTLNQLVEVQKQQKTSYESLERLNQQHREWQTTIERLLQNITASTEGKISLELINESFGTIQDEITQAPRRHELKKVPSLFNERTYANNWSILPLKKLVSEALKDATRSSAVGKPFKQKQRFIAERIVRAHWFEYVTGLIILVNLVMVGVELEMGLSTPGFYEKAVWPHIAERIFLAIYFVEVVLRWVAGGWSNFKDPWFWMDLFLVALGIFALVLAPLFGGSNDLGFERLLVFRGLRLLRLVRALRMVNHFKIMWRLVYGLLTCGETILSTMALILVSLFVFACVAIELIARDDDLRQGDNVIVAHIVENHFSSLGRTIMTLMQFVTLDSISAVYYPLITAKPFLVVFFLPILVVVSIGLMNLVTAALVENAMANAAQQAEEEKATLKAQLQHALPSLLELFQKLDEDGSGMLTEEELAKVHQDILPPRILQSAFAEDMSDLFHYLDVDGTGTLSQSEFIEGLLNLCLLDLPLSTVQSLKLLRLIREEVLYIAEMTVELKGILAERRHDDYTTVKV